MQLLLNNNMNNSSIEFMNGNLQYDLHLNFGDTSSVRGSTRMGEPAVGDHSSLSEPTCCGLPHETNGDSVQPFHDDRQLTFQW